MENSHRFYITTPIYYVNDKPHIGHAYTTILADVLARFHRMKGDETFFLTGVDEHGQKVQQAAEKAGIDPQTHCDNMVVHFQNAWKKLEITNDFFIRTTFDFHKTAVRKALTHLYNKGDIYLAEYGGLYCLGCERFYTEKELVDGKCPQHLIEPVFIKEKNYFFRMSKYQEWLVDYIQKNPDFIQPESRRNEVLGFLRNQLDDLCISRPKSRLKWGIELPFDADYVTYVWFDALLNYMTAVGYGQDDEKFRKWWPADYHLIGKDIVTTHCVYWPTMLKALDLPLPKTIFAHGWWMVSNTKMSKSLKNIVQPLDLIDAYGVDPVRYFLMRDMVLGQDANFSEEMFIKRYNSELANDFGNLANRISTLIQKNFDGIIPAPNTQTDDEKEIQSKACLLPKRVHGLIAEFRLNEALDEIIVFIRSLNKYMEVRQPWQLVKTDKAAAGTVLYTAAEGLRLATLLLQPVMPEKSRILLDILPTEPNQSLLFEWGRLKVGGSLGEMPILFPRIDLKKESEKPLPKKETVPEVPLITIDDFSKVKLVTAKVLTAVKVENSDKLLKLMIDTGNVSRQIVAGIAQHYSPEQIVGKTIVVVSNLQPAKIFGIESNGMLLAAKKSGKLTLITVSEEIAPGATIG
ncbi:MAG: methionine--tRNA ligase [Candidatus Marinimicrobia bacterium CG08_land_8_20_14_0_20_45_22]|nr:MAG: methionine--tRNA ligase [Candidatus Marinimicrobia bacterium CG08_land_8_20_14_0_20_45_22]